ncbi:MAG TPA: UvrD-helicase domain-containing protein [Thermoanaerobaculia bacterium]|nr:UvrD-helicase domain-containing protein [Thermoanaerobaculia bacterium]
MTRAGATLPDAKARRAIVEDLNENLFVEAAAGTGKTSSLVDRMRALVLAGKPVERLCAVTFTVKAAAQLKERFQVALETSRRETTDPERRARLGEAIDGMDRCFVGTIHSFCARLLRERPVEAGLDPEFVELDETRHLLLRSEAWERYKQKLFVESNPVLPELARYGIPLEVLRDAYECFAENPDVQAGTAGRLAEPDFAQARSRVPEFLAAARAGLPAREPVKGWDKLQRKLRSALRLARILDLDKSTSFAAVLERLDGSNDVTLNRWPDAAVARRLADEFEALRDEVVRPALQGWREFLYPIVVDAVVPAAAEFERLRREKGALDFNDLLLKARNLLRDHPEVRQEFQERFTPVLVDEFQDTDPIQAEVLLYLTGGDFAEKDWRKLAPVEGSLFVVGDPKQSIYRFRRADIETYARVKERVLASGGRVVDLTANFRSAPEVCSWINGVFDDTFPREATPAQPAHARLHPERKSTGGPSGAFRLEFPPAGSRAWEAVARQDAIRIAAWIRSAIDSGFEVCADRSRGGSDASRRSVEPGDFLLLFRYKKRMDLYAKELEARGVPYEISGGGAFSESEDLADLLPVLETLVDPANPVSLVASLSGPCFGVDDDALYRFRKSGGRFHLFAPVPAAADPRIARALRMLTEAHEFSRSLPPGAALASICEKLGAISYGGARELGGTRAGNLLKACSIARSLSARGSSFASIVRYLRELTAASDAEEMSTRPGETMAVRLMTLHRAKGLEAPIVFLADPTGERETSVDWCVDRKPGVPQGWLRVAERPDRRDREIARPEGWSERAEIERGFQEAEKDRLLYVAATRAADLLVVSVGPDSIKSPWGKLARAATEPLPEVARPRAAPAPQQQPDLTHELAASRRARKERRDSSRRPAYAVEQVTHVAHDRSASPFASRTGRGMTWGRVIHSLLDGAMKNPGLDVRLYAANLLAEEERAASEVEDAVRLVEAVRRSPLWRRALGARRRLTEVPFALMAPSADLGLTGGPAETLLQGAIDLVFEEDSGWILVDYKTDTIAGNLRELVAFYSPQIELYRRYWRELTGRPTRAGLYFVSTGEEVWPDSLAIQ